MGGAGNQAGGCPTGGRGYCGGSAAGLTGYWGGSPNARPDNRTMINTVPDATSPHAAHPAYRLSLRLSLSLSTS